MLAMVDIFATVSSTPMQEEWNGSLTLAVGAANAGFVILALRGILVLRVRESQLSGRYAGPHDGRRNINGREEDMVCSAVDQLENFIGGRLLGAKQTSACASIFSGRTENLFTPVCLNKKPMHF